MTDVPGSATSPITVLLVDVQALVRTGLQMVLDAQPEIDVVGTAGNGADAVRLTADLHPDVILMDVQMPGMDGLEATRQIVATYPACRIIILTTFDLDEYAFAALRAGASGFLLKDTRPAELVQAIHAVATGDASISPRITRRMLELFGAQLPGVQHPEQASLPELADTLTPREREILVGIGDGLTNGELAARFFLTESTIKTHVGRVFLKLGLRDRVQAVIYLYENPSLRG